jgi:glycosyltransferase involved in cell wall biosynthesis
MRILQVCPYFHPHLGGVESHVMDISRKLIEKGHEVRVLTSMYTSLPETEEVRGVPVTRLKPIASVFQTPITPGIQRVLAGAKVDIVHGHSPPPLDSFYVARSRKEASWRYVVTYHCDLSVPHPLGPAAVWLYERTLGSYAIRNADKLVVTTNTYAATSRAVWRAEPAVVPNAVDHHHFRPGLEGAAIRKRHGVPAEEKVVLFVGRLVGHKGIDYLLRAAPHVDARILVVGAGEKRKEYVERARRLGGRVTFAGRVSYADLPAYYAAADLFTLPSVGRLEAFGIAALEAMACGRAVVLADIPGMREIITDGVEGLLSEPMNDEDLAEKINTLLADDEARAAMGLRGRRKVEERFTADSVASQLEAVYEDVLQSATVME